MPKLIMVPLDGSAFAEQALPHALAIARRAHARLHLVTVRASLPLDFADAGPVEAYIRSLASQIESELPSRISTEVLTDELGPLEYPPPAANSVATVLSRHAAERGVDLIVMTTHGRGGVRRAWLGSAADSLIRMSPTPVLMVRPEDESFGVAARADRGLRHILVPLDGSADGERALEFAEAIGDLFDARYTLVRVVSPLTWGIAAEAYVIGDVPRPGALSRQAALDYLEDVAELMRGRHRAVAVQVLDAGAPAGAIVEYATTHAADLIVIATSGAGRISRLLLGSVADKVVRGTDVPVLTCNVRQLGSEAETVATAEAAAGAQA